MAEDDFFIGWAETPSKDRRFFVKMGAALMIGTGALGAGAAAFQKDPGPGTWNAADERTWTGLLRVAPYPMLRTVDISGMPMTALLSCAVKCGVTREALAFDGQFVDIKGSLVQRGGNALISASDSASWINAVKSTPQEGISMPAASAARQVTLSGEILDSKCWFGAMRPSSGKVHKACASLCIKSGIPPAFFAKDNTGRATLMIMTDSTGAFGEDLLEFVADPVRVTGDIQQSHGLTFLRTSTRQIQRI